MHAIFATPASLAIAATNATMICLNRWFRSLFFGSYLERFHNRSCFRALTQAISDMRCALLSHIETVHQRFTSSWYRAPRPLRHRSRTSLCSTRVYVASCEPAAGPTKRQRGTSSLGSGANSRFARNRYVAAVCSLARKSIRQRAVSASPSQAVQCFMLCFWPAAVLWQQPRQA